MEELEELEPIDEGEISAVAPAPPRTSIPPPIPKHALERTLIGERGAPIVGGRASVPPLRSSFPPAPPPSGAVSSTPPSSGIYRIPETKTEIDRWKDVVRDLELKVRLRDDLISELKRSLEEQRKLVLAAEARASSADRRASSAPAPTATPDDLKRIKGVGPAFERKLHTLGVTSYAHVAAWTVADIDRMAEALGILPQRISRDGWIESAAKLQAK
jgi:predicted flap endonuclease-1-like 5' DNA nuclease